MVRRALASLVESSVVERELHTALKTDLSVFDLYADPDDEYIVFAEFPIGNGCADFVVFTSRSRMGIIIIEVKGADFSFVNADGTISAQINHAAQQIRERFGDIEDSYHSFRHRVHSVRMAVENRQQKYNSLLGPSEYLLVDPQKDVDCWGVVIGGRTREDYNENRLKRQLEKQSGYRVRFESWDSLLRKL